MITVHDRELCRELLGYDQEREKEDERKRVNVSRSHSEAQFSESAAAAALSRSNTHSQLLRAQEWLSRKARRTIVSLPTEPDVKAIQAMCSELEKERQELFKEIEDYMSTAAHYKQCKKEMLYQKWKDQVFLPLQSAITKTLQYSYSFNDTQRKQLFNQYLHVQNNKGVFLDTITVEEYNPMRLHYIAARAQTPCLDDPLLSQQRDHFNELTVMHNCDVGASSDGSSNIKKTLSSGCTNTDPVQWLAMKLIQINSEDRYRSRQKVKDYQSATHFLDATTLIRETDDASDEPQVPHKTPIKYKRDEEINLKWS